MWPQPVPCCSGQGAPEAPKAPEALIQRIGCAIAGAAQPWHLRGYEKPNSISLRRMAALPSDGPFRC